MNTDPYTIQSLEEARITALEAEHMRRRALFQGKVMEKAPTEEYVCKKYFGGMPIEKAVEILKEHAPEYFI